MNENIKVGEEEIIAHLLGELSQENDSLVKEALDQNPDLRKLESELADTLRLVSKSGKEPFPKISDIDWCLSPEMKNKIFPDPGEESKEDQSNTTTKKSVNLLFWVPLGVAACAFLIVMSSNSGNPSTLETAQNREREINTVTPKKSLNTEEELSELAKEVQLDQLLQQQAQEGATEILAIRTTAEVEKMNEELKEPLSLSDAFASSERPQINSVPPVISPPTMMKMSSKENGNNLARSIEKIDLIKNSPKLLETKTPKTKKIGSKASPINIAKDVTNMDIPMELDKESSNLKDLAFADSPKAIQVKGERFSDILPIPAQQSKIKSGFQLIEHSGTVNLFTPTGRALGKVRITRKLPRSIEFLRMQETKLGKSALLKGSGYQLRFTGTDSTVVIVVGNLGRLNPINEAKIKNDLAPYLLQIKDAWTLDEKEIRQPLDLGLSE